MSLGWLLPTGFAVVLEFFVIYYLARGPLKRFPFVLVFCAAEILFVLPETLFSNLAGVRSLLYIRTYWTGDMLAHGVIMLLTLSLIWEALEYRESRQKTLALLTLGVLCFAFYSAYIFHAQNLNRWMTSLSRNLSFGEELLNLILWGLLIQRRDFDHVLLMVSAGIGVQVTGEAIGHTLRLYTQPSMLWVPNLLVYVAEILCLGIWIWAFRSASNNAPGLPKQARVYEA